MTADTTEEPIAQADCDFRGECIELENSRPLEDERERRTHYGRAMGSPIAIPWLPDLDGNVQPLQGDEDEKSQDGIQLLAGGSG